MQYRCGHGVCFLFQKAIQILNSISRHCRRQLRYLQKSYHGSLCVYSSASCHSLTQSMPSCRHRLSSKPSISIYRRMQCCLGYMQREYISALVTLSENPNATAPRSTPSISTVSHAGSRHAMYAHLTTVNGNSRSAFYFFLANFC